MPGFVWARTLVFAGETGLTLSEAVVGVRLGVGKHLGMSCDHLSGLQTQEHHHLQLSEVTSPSQVFVLSTVHHVLYFRSMAGTPAYMELSDASCACGGMLLTVAFLLLGVKEGILWKRGRDNGQFLPRKFVLSEREGCLKYFTKQDVSMVVSSHLSVYSTQGSGSWRHSYLLRMFLRLPCASQARDANRNMSLTRGLPFLLSG